MDDNREFDGVDSFLEALVRTCNDFDFSLGITLNVGGLIISGMMVSEKGFFIGAGDMFANGDDDLGAMFSEMLKQHGEEIQSKNIDFNLYSPTYIHLKDAKFYLAGTKTIPENGVWWRGKLASVDGYSLGNIVENVI